MMPCCTGVWCHVVQVYDIMLYRCMMPCCTGVWCHVVQVYDVMLYRRMMSCCTSVWCHVVHVYDIMLYRCMMSCCTYVWYHVVQVYADAEYEHIYYNADKEQRGDLTVPVYKYFEWKSNIPICWIAVSFSSVWWPEVLSNCFRKYYTPDLPRMLCYM